LHRSILVNKDSTNCASTTTIANIDISKVQSNATTHSTSDVGNDTQMEIEKEKEGKNWTVKVCMDSDVEIIGEAFVSSQTIGVEWQQNVDDKVVLPTGKVKKVISKKQTRKIAKVHKSNEKSSMKVHQVLHMKIRMCDLRDTR